jgi:hypothetical protein
MKAVKDICTVVPAVLITSAAVLGIGVVIGLSSFALLSVGTLALRWRYSLRRLRCRREPRLMVASRMS